MINQTNLAAFVEVLRDPKHYLPDIIAFDMSDFGTTRTILDVENEELKTYEMDALACGTVCCAIGLAGLAPKTRALGIVQDLKSGEFTVDGIEVPNGFCAAAEWLDISLTLAHRIFRDHPKFYHANGFTDHADVTLKPEHVILALHALNDPNHVWVDRDGVPIF